MWPFGLNTTFVYRKNHMSKLGLQKTERVRSQKVIDTLFGKTSKAFMAYGFRFSWVWLEPNAAHCAVLFISSKKKLKTAVERNRRKRLLRELYRLNKTPLLEYLKAENRYIALSLNYTGADELSMKLHQANFIKALNKLNLELQKNNTVSIYPAH
jgi:ribonuclease P protein component